MISIRSYLLVILSTFILLSSCSEVKNNFWPEDKSPEIISSLLIKDLLSRPDFMMYNTPNVKAVHYAEVCAAFGASRLADMTDNDSIIDQLVDRYKKVISDSIINTANHVDANVYGILPLELFNHPATAILAMRAFW